MHVATFGTYQDVVSDFYSRIAASGLYEKVDSINLMVNGSIQEFNLDIMKRDISTCEFDVAIVGCGGYSLLINEYIKSLGKPSIHLGGSAQLIFGIKGGRWDSNEKFVNSDWYGKTKYWIRPLKHEIPSQNKLLENGAYW